MFFPKVIDAPIERSGIRIQQYQVARRIKSRNGRAAKTWPSLAEAKFPYEQARFICDEMNWQGK